MRKDWHRLLFNKGSSRFGLGDRQIALISEPDSSKKEHLYGYR